jgi:branched-chain amino acid transport system ATP-binding protein
MTGKGISVDHVSVQFGGLRALDDVSLEALPGLITGLVGPNGAGKSTLYNVMTAVIKPTSGRVFVDGQDVSSLSQHEISRRGVARTFQTPRGFPSLSVLDNVLVAADHASERLVGSLLGRRLPPETLGLAMSVLERVGLADQAKQKYSRLSAGEARLLELARHLMRDPAYVLLDEPTAGVAPELQDRLAAILQGLRSDGRTLICVEHNMRFLRELADHILVLEAGQVIATGAPEVVFSDERVIAAYLGEKRRTHARD